MKKFLSVVLAMILALGLLAGCAKTENKTTEPTAAPTEAAAETTETTEEAATEEAAATEETAATEEATEEAAEEATEETAAADSDWAYIKEKGTLVVGMTLFAPMNYYDADNNFVGFDTELAMAVGKKLGVNVEFIEIDWSAKEIELNSKNIDVIWNGMCITEERKANMSITNPYLINTQAMVMKADKAEALLANVDGAAVVAESGSTGEGKLQGTIEDDETVEVSAKEYFANANYTAVDSMAKAIMEVKSGLADIALVDSVCALGMVTPESDYADLVVNLDNNFGLQYYGIAFRQGSDVTAMVNQAIAELTEEGVVAEIAAKYGLTEALVTAAE